MPSIWDTLTPQPNSQGLQQLSHMPTVSAIKPTLSHPRSGRFRAILMLQGKRGNVARGKNVKAWPARGHTRAKTHTLSSSSWSKSDSTFTCCNYAVVRERQGAMLFTESILKEQEARTGGSVGGGEPQNRGAGGAPQNGAGAT